MRGREGGRERERERTKQRRKQSRGWLAVHSFGVDSVTGSVHAVRAIGAKRQNLRQTQRDSQDTNSDSGVSEEQHLEFNKRIPLKETRSLTSCSRHWNLTNVRRTRLAHRFPYLYKKLKVDRFTSRVSSRPAAVPSKRPCQ